MGSRSIALLMPNPDTTWVWAVKATLLPVYSRGKAPVLIVQEAAWAPGTFWTSVENLFPTGN